MPGLRRRPSRAYIRIVLPQWTYRLELLCVCHSHVAKPMLGPLPKCSTGLFLECWTLRGTADGVRSVLTRGLTDGGVPLCVCGGGVRVCNGRRAHGLHQCLLAPELEDKWPPHTLWPQFQLSFSTAPACSVSRPLPQCSNAIPWPLCSLLSVVSSSSYSDCLILNSYASFKTYFKYHFLWTLPDKQGDLFPMYTQLPAVKSSITLIMFTLNHLLYIPASSKLKFFWMKNFLFIIIAPMPEI